MYLGIYQLSYQRYNFSKATVKTEKQGNAHPISTSCWPRNCCGEIIISTLWQFITFAFSSKLLISRCSVLVLYLNYFRAQVSIQISYSCTLCFYPVSITYCARFHDQIELEKPNVYHISNLFCVPKLICLFSLAEWYLTEYEDSSAPFPSLRTLLPCHSSEFLLWQLMLIWLFHNLGDFAHLLSKYERDVYRGTGSILTTKSPIRFLFFPYSETGSHTVQPLYPKMTLNFRFSGLHLSGL